MAKRKHSASRKKAEDSSDSPQKSEQTTRHPKRRRNRDDEILNHHWEVVYDDSPVGRKRAKKKKARPTQEAEKSRKTGAKESAKQETQIAQKGKDKKPQEGRAGKSKSQKAQRAAEKARLAAEKARIAAEEARRAAEEARRAEEEAARLEEGVEKTTESEAEVKEQNPRQKKRKRPARTKKAAEEQRPLEEVQKLEVQKPEEPSEPEKKKKKRPSRKRRKKRTAETDIEPGDGKAESAPQRREKIAPEPKQSQPEETKPEEPQPFEEAGRFWDMELSSATQAALHAADYLEPTPVQAGLIPKAILGNDLMGQARTGTGKTAAFAIPILELIDTTEKHRGPQALVLVPTRELAVQVRDECAKLAMNSKARIVAVYGGKPIRQQMEKLRRGAEVVVGTPGRVMDHMSRGTLFLGDLRIAVLDEADRMLDIGFRPDIEKILRQCPQSRQTLLLSATIPPPVKRLAERYMRDPEMLDFSPSDVAVETIEQFYFTVDASRKFDLLVKLLQRENPRQAIVFCRTRKGTERIHRRLQKKEPGAACIHGDLPQRTRDRVMSDFRAGKVRLLMATDVVGRGIDVSSVSHIINYDTPEFCDDYVHRVGRTGRMGREGVAYSFVTPEEGNELTRIEMRINRLLKRDEIAGFSIDERAASDVEGEEKSDPKPVYGRHTRRVRRAL